MSRRIRRKEECPEMLYDVVTKRCVKCLDIPLDTLKKIAYTLEIDTYHLQELSDTSEENVKSWLCDLIALKIVEFETQNFLDLPTKSLDNLPCDVLLMIAENVDPADYLTLIEVSKAIHKCLTTGGYKDKKWESKLKAAKEKLHMYVLEADVKFIKNLIDPSEAVQLFVVNQKPKYIKYIKNPTEKVQMFVINQNPRLIEYINKPTEDAQMMSLIAHDTRNNQSNIKYIKNPTEKVQMQAVGITSHNIKYIRNPDEKIQLLAINDDPFYIQYIKNPTEKVQLKVLQQNGWDFRLIKNPTEKVQLYVVNWHYPTIMDIKNPTEKVQILAIKKYPQIIKYIKNPSNNAQILAVQLDPSVIKLINNPSREAVALAKQTKTKRQRKDTDKDDEFEAEHFGVETPATIIKQQNEAYEKSLTSDRERDQLRMDKKKTKEDDVKRVNLAETEVTGERMLRFSVLLPQSKILNVVFNENAPVSALLSAVSLKLPVETSFRLISPPYKGKSDIVIESDDIGTFRERGIGSAKLLFQEIE